MMWVGVPGSPSAPANRLAPILSIQYSLLLGKTHHPSLRRNRCAVRAEIKDGNTRYFQQARRPFNAVV